MATYGIIHAMSGYRSTQYNYTSDSAEEVEWFINEHVHKEVRHLYVVKQLLDPVVYTPPEDAGELLLKGIQEALRRLGDDPEYYEADAEMVGHLAGLNPDLPRLINEYLKEVSNG
jgi:hypothetical protein